MLALASPSPGTRGEAKKAPAIHERRISPFASRPLIIVCETGYLAVNPPSGQGTLCEHCARFGLEVFINSTHLVAPAGKRVPCFFRGFHVRTWDEWTGRKRAICEKARFR